MVDAFHNLLGAQELNQADILRSVMSLNGLTRNEFCEMYGVKRRTLDAWLLPATSKGKRAAPSGLLRQLIDVVATHDHCPCVFDHVPLAVGERRPACSTNGLQVNFPLLHLVIQQGQNWEVIDNVERRKIEYRALAGRYRQEFYILHPECQVKRGPMQDSCAITPAPIPQLLNGEPRWIFVRHHRSWDHLDGYLAALNAWSYTQEYWMALEDFGVARIGDDIFSLTSFPAPNHAPIPMFIYQTEIVKFLGSRLIVDCWTHCIDIDGQTHNRVPSPDDMNDQ